jgi:predicted tellurium resistance membrane protein TerC
VIAVAAAAKGSLSLLIIGLAISIPLIVFGSTLILKLMDRFPVIITLGGGLLGFVAGEMVISDSALSGWINAYAFWLHYIAPALGTIVVVVLGKWLAARAAARTLQTRMVDLAETDIK